MPKSVAFFDFDHTLIMGDSFWPYLTHAAGALPAYAALGLALAAFAMGRIQGERREARDFIKDYLIRRLLTGKRVGQLEGAALKTRQWQVINSSVLNALHEHRAAGDTIVIASGGLSLYLPEVLRDIPYDAIISTDIGVENGVVTGVMTNGNCVRATKAQRVALWLSTNGPFDQSWAYGNYPHDVPMMAHVKHRIIVS